MFILTGFILLPWNEAETDGIISSTVFARFVIRAFGAKPVMLVPEQCEKAIKAMSEVLGVDITYDIDNIPDNTICIVSFTKDKNKEEEQTQEILSHGLPCAVISNEAPGRNKNGYYHNAVGVNTTDIEAKYDVLFRECQSRGIYNLSIGDLGNELGMGTIEKHIRKYIPYAEKGGCKAGTGFGILADTAADNIITATVSDWGMNALMACTAFLLNDLDLFHTEKEEAAVMDAAASAYLEEYCDRYEETLGFDNRTYRACPGYGDFPLEFNKRIAILLDIPRKIGVTITPNNLLIPQKSMLGLIGIGSDKRKKSCGNCVMKEDCPFRKRGQRCYRTD